MVCGEGCALTGFDAVGRKEFVVTHLGVWVAFLETPFLAIDGDDAFVL